MNCVWKLKGLPPGLAGGTASAAVVASDMLLNERRGERTKSGLRKPLSRDKNSSSMSFQLLWLRWWCNQLLLPMLLAREGGRSRSMRSSA